MRKIKQVAAPYIVFRGEKFWTAERTMSAAEATAIRLHGKHGESIHVYRNGEIVYALESLA